MAIYAQVSPVEENKRPKKRVPEEEVQYSEPIDSKRTVPHTSSLRTSNSKSIIMSMESQQSQYSEPIDSKRTVTHPGSLSTSNGRSIIISMESQYSEPIDSKRTASTGFIVNHSVVSHNSNANGPIQVSQEALYSEPFQQNIPSSSPPPPPIPSRLHLPDIITNHNNNVS